MVKPLPPPCVSVFSLIYVNLTGLPSPIAVVLRFFTLEYFCFPVYIFRFIIRHLGGALRESGGDPLIPSMRVMLSWMKKASQFQNSRGGVRGTYTTWVGIIHIEKGWIARKSALEKQFFWRCEPSPPGNEWSLWHFGDRSHEKKGASFKKLVTWRTFLVKNIMVPLFLQHFFMKKRCAHFLRKFSAKYIKNTWEKRRMRKYLNKKNANFFLEIVF